MSKRVYAEQRQRGSVAAAALAFASLASTLSRLTGAISAVLLAAICGLILLEIFWRTFLSASLHFTWEFSTYAQAGVFYLGAAYALYTLAHVRVSALLQFLSPGAARRVDVFCTIVALAVVVYITQALSVLAWTSLAGNVRSWTPSETPIGYPQLLVAVGFGLLALQFLARLIRLLVGEEPDDRTPLGELPVE